MKEENAKELFCPHNNERMEENDYYLNTRCIGGDCMMWRWRNDAGSEGYCGLAGKPDVWR